MHIKYYKIVKRKGGLNLVNIRNKEIALKATWPKILIHEQDYSVIVYTQLRANGIKENLWRCSLNEEDVPFLRIKNPFWEDVLKCWCKHNYYKGRRIENQLIWYNSRIRVEGKPFVWNNSLDRGLLYVYQLFEGGEFKTYSQVWQEYGLSKLRYNSLKSAIPKQWKQYFLETPPSCFLPIPPHNYDVDIEVFSPFKINIHSDGRRHNSGP